MPPHTHTHTPSPWGSTQRKTVVRKTALCKAFGHYKDFFYREEERGDTWSLPGKDE